MAFGCGLRVSYQFSAVDVRGANKATLRFKSDTIALLMSFLENAHACSC